MIMAGRRDMYSQNMMDFSCIDADGAYDYGGGTMNVSAISSSGSSEAGSPRQMQRYPQTSSPYRGYREEEPCLNAPASGPTAGELRAKYYSTQGGGRYKKNVQNARTRSPGGTQCQRSKRQQCDDYTRILKNMCDEMEADEMAKYSPPSSPYQGKASPAKRQVQYSYGPSANPGACGPPGTDMRSKYPSPNTKRSDCPPQSCVPKTPLLLSADQVHRFGNLADDPPDVCAFKEFDDGSEEGFLAKLMRKLRGPPPPPNPCPLQVDHSRRKKRSAIPASSRRPKDEHSLERLDDLWNPETYMRWKVISNWDQHKESLWRSNIQGKLDCPESHVRCIEDMMLDAFKAMKVPGAECIAYRMIYGILRRNEDMYLNPYIHYFTDDQFVKLIITLNRFYIEDKDKRKMFFDHPPPTFIEKIMMKETLSVIDPECPSPTIARRFWELLLDWYSKKIQEQQAAMSATEGLENC